MTLNDVARYTEIKCMRDPKSLPSDLNFAALGLKPSDSRFVDPKVVSWTLSRCRVIYYRALRALRLLALELPPPLAPLVGRQFKCDEHFFKLTITHTP